MCWDFFTHTEKVKKWQQQLRSQQRQVEREQRQLAQAQEKTRQQLKQLANKGQLKEARILAREVVRSQKASTRLATTKATLNSIHMQLSHQLGPSLHLRRKDSLYCLSGDLLADWPGTVAATLKISGTLQHSTEILKMTSSLIKLPEMGNTMREMSAEMSKAGIMDEMLDDVMETEDLDEEGEEEAEGEVEKVLWDITDGKLGNAQSTANLPQLQKVEPSQQDLEHEQQENKRMQEQLNALLSGN